MAGWKTIFSWRRAQISAIRLHACHAPSMQTIEDDDRRRQAAFLPGWTIDVGVCIFLRRRMREALGVGSIVGMYARPRDCYVALFAPDTSLDDESLTASGCPVAMTQGFLLRPCHLQLPLWLAKSLGPVPFSVPSLTSCTDGLT